MLLPVGPGVTAYGLAYLVVHDLYIHRRLPLLPARVAWLEPLAEAHGIHHRYGGAPFGMLCPVVPARLRARAGDAARAAVAGRPHEGSDVPEAAATRRRPPIRRRSPAAAAGASQRPATATLRAVGTRTRRLKTS